MVGFHAAAAAHAAAEAARKRTEQEEEEELTRDHSEPTDKFEYKIIRSATSAFKNPARFKTILEEESHAGWELHEKLDDARARLRRHVAWREKDVDLTLDPYRTKVGMSEGIMALWVVLGVLAGLATVIVIVTLSAK
jgi:hypothetical protein